MEEKVQQDVRRAAAGIGGAVMVATGNVVLVTLGLAGVVYGVWPRRDDGSWRFPLRAPERLPQPKHVTVRWHERGDRTKKSFPISTLWVTDLTVVNPTDVPVEIRVTGHWSLVNVDVTVDESRGKGDFRVEGQSLGPKIPIGEMVFEMPARERYRHQLNFSTIQESRRYLRVTDRMTNRVLQTISIDDGSRWRRFKVNLLYGLRQLKSS